MQPTNPYGTPNVRKYPRIRIDVSVRVVSNSAAPASGRTHEISKGGMSLYIPIELAAGMDLKLAFVLPYSRLQFDIAAVVRHRSGFCYGLEFLKLTATQAMEIERVIRILTLT
jgi:c-di-GMP-binding flagellar brake protein YcgR